MYQRDFVIEDGTNESLIDHIIDTNNLSDCPSKDDSLSRKSLAQYLAKRLYVIYERDVKKADLGSFFMLMDGAWGSGKSTLMGFIKDVLEGTSADSKTATKVDVSEICYTLFRGKLTTFFAGKEMQLLL